MHMTLQMNFENRFGRIQARGSRKNNVTPQGRAKAKPGRQTTEGSDPNGPPPPPPPAPPLPAPTPCPLPALLLFHLAPPGWDCKKLGATTLSFRCSRTLRHPGSDVEGQQRGQRERSGVAVCVLLKPSFPTLPKPSPFTSNTGSMFEGASCKATAVPAAMAPRWPLAPEWLSTASARTAVHTSRPDGCPNIERLGVGRRWKLMTCVPAISETNSTSTLVAAALGGGLAQSHSGGRGGGTRAVQGSRQEEAVRIRIMCPCIFPSGVASKTGRPAETTTSTVLSDVSIFFCRRGNCRSGSTPDLRQTHVDCTVHVS